MRFARKITTLILSLVLFFNLVPSAIACGPESIEPIFVFKNSPDPPFEEFTRGKLGILQPSMGRKTLFIGYRYIKGGSFTGAEQRALIEALKGKAPEDEGDDAVKAWIEARKEIVLNEETLPAIYTERRYGGYDFFPNCTSSGFYTAIETLNDRTAAYGKEDPHVRDWLASQDRVFQNCAGGSSIPPELGADKPEWLRKDRDYQIAAAYFYSLNLGEALDRFERIAADNESPWRQTADYLVARTLIRQASLANDATRKRAIYEQAERHLMLLIGAGGKFLNASEKLLALVNYRLRPEERVGELGRILVNSNGNDNLRQDLIDYVWLVDKFDNQVTRAEQERKNAINNKPEEPEFRPDPERTVMIEAVNRGELIDIHFGPKLPNGEYDYEKFVTLTVKHDTSEAEILESIVRRLGRELTPEEIKEIEEIHKNALAYRSWLLAPNRSLSKVVESQYEGDKYYGEISDDPSLDLFPAFLRNDELTDWILTFQSTDPKAYLHALSRWRDTDSAGWLVAALSKADNASPDLDRLLRQAEKITHESAAYPTIAYHLVRLRIALGNLTEARKLLEDVLLSETDLLSVSAMNQFRELGRKLSFNLGEFLRFGQRKPAAFYEYGRYGSISDFLKIAKTQWDPEYSKQTKEEFELDVEERYNELLRFENQFVLDEKTLDILNTHFPLTALAEVGRDPALPDYLQQRVRLSLWTRAVLLKNEKVARNAAVEIITRAPELKPLFAPYLDARTPEEKEHAALFILLQSPSLSPFVTGGLSIFLSSEQTDYYFEMSWWCTPSETDYDIVGNEVTKIIDKPGFLTPPQLETARREHASLVSMGNGKSHLGKKVIGWAKQFPNDVRVPEALFIAVEANKSYKYGCGAWESDESLVNAAGKILRTRYPDSVWTAKLSKSEN